MKVFKTVGMTPEETEELLGEARLLSQLGHPNIVRVFDANVTETSAGVCGFFTMEYVAGGSLEQFWKSHGRSFVPLETTIDILRQVCRGLATAHAADPPIVHRDIKPQNILVGYDLGGLRARVGDFGLARQVNPLTMLASARGTPRFKAPEVFRDVHSDSCAGDVWSLGATLYLMLTDQLPYGDDDADPLDTRRFDQPLVSIRRTNLLVDEQLERIVLKSLALKVADRYANASEFLVDLEAWKPQPLKAPPPPADLPLTEQWRNSKQVLGPPGPISESEGQRLSQQALEMAKASGRLIEAADLMEVWRRGICM
jgi:eukaryotic-like serine/threonine-protein kinase